MTLPEFAIAIFQYCALSGGSVTSWIRSPLHNDASGGVKGSPHLFGCGADVVYDSPGSAARRNALALRCGLLRIEEADHDHLQPIGWPAG